VTLILTEVKVELRLAVKKANTIPFQVKVQDVVTIMQESAITSEELPHMRLLQS
jgi:hypothetical protein